MRLFMTSLVYINESIGSKPESLSALAKEKIFLSLLLVNAIIGPKSPFLGLLLKGIDDLYICLK